MSHWTQHRPCEACPYRRDTPVGIWSAEEYQDLIAKDGSAMGSVYGCHLNAARPSDEAQPCAGFLADQKRRGVPSIALRLALVSNASAAECFEQVDERDPTLYESIREMVDANVGRAFPTASPKARRLLKKLRAGDE